MASVEGKVSILKEDYEKIEKIKRAEKMIAEAQQLLSEVASAITNEVESV